MWSGSNERLPKERSLELKTIVIDVFHDPKLSTYVKSRVLFMKSLVLRGKELQSHAVPFCPSIVHIYLCLCCFFRLSILAWGRIRGPA